MPVPANPFRDDGPAMGAPGQPAQAPTDSTTARPARERDPRPEYPNAAGSALRLDPQ
jgi:hypothetical protein